MRVKNLFLSSVAVGVLALAALPAYACDTSNDCGTVLATGFGAHCAWVRVQSTVFPGHVTTYGLPQGNLDLNLVPSTAQKGGPISIRSGATFNCQGGVPQIIYMSNDPAEQ